MSESFSALGFFVHTPCGPRKSGMPDSVEMPAPVSTTTRAARSTQPRTFSMSAVLRIRLDQCPVLPSRPLGFIALNSLSTQSGLPQPDPALREKSNPCRFLTGPAGFHELERGPKQWEMLLVFGLVGAIDLHPLSRTRDTAGLKRDDVVPCEL